MGQRMNPTAAAVFLSMRVSLIACREDAGVCFVEVKRAVEEIERAINRPVPPRRLGPCPTLVGHHKACATHLTAPRKATEVTCPECKTTHQVEYLMELLRHELLYWPLSSVEILGSRTSELPGALDYWNVNLATSTFHHWKKTNLTVRGYRNKTTLVIMPVKENSSDEPLYWLADVLDRMGVEWRQTA
jgi:hypothetical protein